ncbi:MAG: SpoIIIAH-like family protein [Agathobacter sp.]|nr:SpoIIIAH-like family protein [Agathobacter sp.]
MKKIFHKNQIVITSLAVLIAVAGYVSYDRKSGSADDDVQTVANTDLLGSDKNEMTDLSEEDLMKNRDDGEDLNPGEVVLTSADVSLANYAAQVRLNREQVRSKNRETLQSIIDNETLEDAQKQEALNKMLALTDIAEREAGAEMMLEAKGFTNVVVSISEDSCDVVCDMGDVTDQKRAQIEDIVKRKTNIAAENIVITPIDHSAE